MFSEAYPTCLQLCAWLKAAYDELTGGAAVSYSRVQGVADRDLEAARLRQLVLAQVLQLKTALTVLTVDIEERRPIRSDEDALLLAIGLVARELTQ